MIHSYNNRYTYDIIKACKECKFLLSRAFLNSSNRVVLSTWNGVGAKGAWYNSIIPTHIMKVDITLASAPHDYDWSLLKKSYYDYCLSNLHLFFNINQLLRLKIKNKWLLWFALFKSFCYYLAVQSPYGYEIYLKSGKNEK